MNSFFIKKITIISIIFLFGSIFCANKVDNEENRKYNGEYTGEFLNRVAFPIGGIGAGMICLEGTGSISHVSVRNSPNIFYEPLLYATIGVKVNKKNVTKVIEGKVPKWKYFGTPLSGLGLGSKSYGLPRFNHASFIARFPFGKIELEDDEIPLKVEITGWSPFVPGDSDNSSLPVGALEYHFSNTTDQTHEALFSFNSENFMHIPVPSEFSYKAEDGEVIKEFPNGFLLWQNGNEENPHYEGGFAFFIDDENAKINHHWFQGGHFDAHTINWKNLEAGNIVENPPIKGKSEGASLFVPFVLKPGEEKKIILKFCWYVPKSNLRKGNGSFNSKPTDEEACCEKIYYKPWYAGKFSDIYELQNYWQTNYYDLRKSTELFTSSFYQSTLPDVVLEAVTSNLTILKSPTLLRQTDGRLWAWEGSGDQSGCCPGSCTHVWNYAQAIPHLFPDLERTLRSTEFYENQLDEETEYRGKKIPAGFQKFRAFIPIRDTGPGRFAAIDGQLGGIMKVYRDWRISGNTNWLKELWPKVKESIDFCIDHWDPKHNGIIEEPQHNTYDIEFWGPNGMSMSFYAGALKAFIKMGMALNYDVSKYESLQKKCVAYMESELFNKEYFIQKVKWKNMEAGDPIEYAKGSWNVEYSEDALSIYKKEGPKYQYGKGCLSDGIVGLWLAKVCGINDNILDPVKVSSHLKSVYRYNHRKDLTDHVNPQRSGYAMGQEGGLLLCTWPLGGEPTLPFIYSNEVWTGIEYQVASHLIFEGMVNEGLDIVRTLRKRYDGRIRNPFDEYEAGHWYARAMSSYGLLQALSGIRYDAVNETLHIDSRVGDDFSCFFATGTGFGNVGLKLGKPFVEMKMGNIDINSCMVSGKELIKELIIIDSPK